MMEVRNVQKSYGGRNFGSAGTYAVKDVSLSVSDGQVFGLIGTNGAGKSTLLRLMAGVLKADSGEILVDGEPVYDNPAAKKQIFFVPDEAYFFSNADAEDMGQYYRSIYESFDGDGFLRMVREFDLAPERRISTYSKGMKKQLSILLGIASGTKYLLLDETFDGLDPVMRQGVKSLFAREIDERGLTPVITSHNLRELEDICDHVGLLHKGGVLLSQDIDEMKLGLQKIQCVFETEEDRKRALEGLTVLKLEKRGRLETITIRGTRESAAEHFRGCRTVFMEILPLTLEEVFISETEVAGYDVRKYLLD